ncbi:MAG TPA: FAD-binding oxidoreductase [Candidatus Baltobacteraceae bacterium]|nr:FAD-binding oxidoreductase [Candidatus Baltobacteraceae bacterium]
MTSLTGRVLDPTSPGWDAARHNFRAAVDYDELVPKNVVFCQKASDVQNAVRWARENAVPLRARSGRHSYEAYSLAPGALIVDVSEMDEISVDPAAKTARIGAGTYCLDLHEQLYGVGLTIPAASGLSVGIAGLALGGGFGVVSRKYGLTCDNVVGVELVDANGDLVTANATENPDLYWACRGGGGGNFGIVTSFDFRVNPVGLVAVCIVTWQWSSFIAVADAFQHWAPAATDDLSAFLRFAVGSAPGAGTITLFAQLTPDSPAGLAQFTTLLAPMLAAAPPTGVNVQTMPYSAAAATFAGADPLKPEWMIHPHDDTQLFKSTSAIAYEPFPQQALELLKSQLELAPVQQGWETNEPSMVQLLAGGGAPGRVPVDATAVPHRGAVCVVQYDAYWTDPDDQPVAENWIEGVRTSMLPYARNAYVNYVDSRIEDYLDAYYVSNLARLIEVKRAVDPDNVFSFQQSIPTTAPAPKATPTAPKAPPASPNG